MNTTTQSQSSCPPPAAATAATAAVTATATATTSSSSASTPGGNKEKRNQSNSSSTTRSSGKSSAGTSSPKNNDVPSLRTSNSKSSNNDGATPSEAKSLSLKSHSSLALVPLHPAASKRKEHQLLVRKALPLVLGRTNLASWWWKSCSCEHYCRLHCRPVAQNIRSLSKVMIQIDTAGYVHVVGKNPHLVTIIATNNNNNSSDNNNNNNNQHHHQSSSSSSNNLQLIQQHHATNDHQPPQPLHKLEPGDILAIGRREREPWLRFQVIVDTDEGYKNMELEISERQKKQQRKQQLKKQQQQQRQQNQQKQKQIQQQQPQRQQQQLKQQQQQQPQQQQPLQPQQQQQQQPLQHQQQQPMSRQQRKQQRSSGRKRKHSNSSHYHGTHGSKKRSKRRPLSVEIATKASGYGKKRSTDPFLPKWITTTTTANPARISNPNTIATNDTTLSSSSSLAVLKQDHSKHHYYHHHHPRKSDDIQEQATAAANAPVMGKNDSKQTDNNVKANIRNNMKENDMPTEDNESVIASSRGSVSANVGVGVGAGVDADGSSSSDNDINCSSNSSGPENRQTLPVRCRRRSRRPHVGSTSTKRKLSLETASNKVDTDDDANVKVGTDQQEGNQQNQEEQRNNPEIENDSISMSHQTTQSNKKQRLQPPEDKSTVPADDNPYRKRYIALANAALSARAVSKGTSSAINENSASVQKGAGAAQNDDGRTSQKTKSISSQSMNHPNNNNFRFPRYHRHSYSHHHYHRRSPGSNRNANSKYIAGSTRYNNKNNSSLYVNDKDQNPQVHLLFQDYSTSAALVQATQRKKPFTVAQQEQRQQQLQQELEYEKNNDMSVISKKFAEAWLKVNVAVAKNEKRINREDKKKQKRLNKSLLYNKQMLDKDYELSNNTTMVGSPTQQDVPLQHYVGDCDGSQEQQEQQPGSLDKTTQASSATASLPKIHSPFLIDPRQQRERRYNKNNNSTVHDGNNHSKNENSTIVSGKLPAESNDNDEKLSSVHSQEDEDKIFSKNDNESLHIAPSKQLNENSMETTNSNNNSNNGNKVEESNGDYDYDESYPQSQAVYEDIRRRKDEVEVLSPPLSMPMCETFCSADSSQQEHSKTSIVRNEKNDYDNNSNVE